MLEHLQLLTCSSSSNTFCLSSSMLCTFSWSPSSASCSPVLSPVGTACLDGLDALVCTCDTLEGTIIPSSTGAARAGDLARSLFSKISLSLFALQKMKFKRQMVIGPHHQQQQSQQQQHKHGEQQQLHHVKNNGATIKTT